jgi:hypothetical protein
VRHGAETVPALLEGGITMNETAWIVAEIIVGLAVLVVVIGAVSVVATRLLVKRSPADIARERYARGELTREQYHQMRQDFGITSVAENGFRAPQANDRDLGAVPGSRRIK